MEGTLPTVLSEKLLEANEWQESRGKVFVVVVIVFFFFFTLTIGIRNLEPFRIHS